MRNLIRILSLLFLALACFFLYVAYDLQNPGPLTANTTVIIEKGQGFKTAIVKLDEADVVNHPWLFAAEAVALGKARSFKAGEYNFHAGINPVEVMEMMAEGKVVIHKVTVAEGLRVEDVLAMLIADKILTGTNPADVKEGTLLPETYYFTYGDTRPELIARMQAAMDKTLNASWEKRDPTITIATPQEALTLASIVERETGVDNERPRVAAVFENRLKIGMKLQTDPTVAYGIEKDQGKLTHALTLIDLAYNSPYNTYIIPGLPPGPICNPGRAAIEAVLHPLTSNELYFVATGHGGHNFSTTMEEHEKNVRLYHEQVNKNKN